MGRLGGVALALPSCVYRVQPCAAVRDEMNRLEVAIENLYHRLVLSLDHRGEADDFRAAQGYHADATALLETIRASLHDEGNTRATRPTETSRDDDAGEGASPT